MNSNNMSPTKVSLPLTRRGWTKPERITEDVEPTKLLSDTTTTTTTTTTSTSEISLIENEDLCGSSCLVCKKNKARYSCPRCQTPYCSTECYRNHTTTSTESESENENNNNNNPSFSCTEVFFRKKVTSLMELESKEQENKTHQVLNRYHHNQRQHQELAWQTNTNDDEYDDEYDDDDDDNEHDMYQLLSKLEELEEYGDGDGNQLSSIELAKLLPPSIKAMFQRDMENGQIQELVLDRWYPWWRREIVNMEEKDDNNSNNIEEEEEDDDANEGTIENVDTICKAKKCHSKTLDERLLRVPDYCGLGRNKDGRISNNSIDNVLLYNLLDILSATCWTLRLYHGVKNASRQAPVEAAITLIETSSVLSKDARFTTLPHVLSHCCTTIGSLMVRNNGQTALNNDNNNKSINGTTAHWTVFMEDIAFLVTSHRLVGRAILEASDILKAAIKELKDDDDNNNNIDSNNNISNNKSNEIKGKTTDYSNGKKLKQIRRLRKKLQFFLSWTQYPATVELFLGGNTNEEILAWTVERKTMISECQQDDDHDGDGNNDANSKNLISMESFNLPSSVNTTHHQSKIYDDGNKVILETKRPLMVEVQSRRK